MSNDTTKNRPTHRGAPAKYVVETRMGVRDHVWENCWTVDGVPETFATYNDAEEAIKDHIIDCINAVEGGDMEDSPDPSEFRIVAI